MWFQHHFSNRDYLSSANRWCDFGLAQSIDLATQRFDRTHWFDRCWSVLHPIHCLVAPVVVETLSVARNRSSLALNSLGQDRVRSCSADLFPADVGHALCAVAKYCCAMLSNDPRLAYWRRCWWTALVASLAESNPISWYYCYSVMQPNSLHCLPSHRHNSQHQPFHPLLRIATDHSEIEMEFHANENWFDYFKCTGKI